MKRLSGSQQPERKPLTGRQMAVLNFILAHIKENCCPPTCHEICEAFNFKSPNAATYYVEALERKGWIRRRATQSARNLIPT